MRTPIQENNNAFPVAKKGKKNKSDVRSAAFANTRRNVRQLPTRQLNRGR
ncbi:hypothetical protein [Actinomadura macrotermitis]|uniref:Uncharacterized protein n=1 Tax=Actinomadura macrotermitis TaxID=2585200 RepID=A0A7K0BX81_9ACTN|nr:hypothetical protein [Actinomadura macrotermitis]MQY05787.1 hypothetical protein [Actinomadura macrotermitis]